MTTILGDADVWRCLAMPRAVEAVRKALDARRRGTLAAPPRHQVSTGPGSLVFTVGGEDGLAGFRVYDTFAGSRQDQVTAVWRDGALLGIVVGAALGAVRTGAIGGVAVDVLARRGTVNVAVLGAGLQARTQLMAAASVRALGCVRVFSRTRASREAYAAQMSAHLGRDVVAVDSVGAAFDGADLILSATTATAPVFRAEQVPDGCHVTVAGPKFQGRHEWPAALAERASRIVTDAPEQLLAYAGAPFLLAGTPHMGRIEDLALARPREAGDGITLFVSTGLAGTEVFVAEALLAARPPVTRGNLFAGADPPLAGERAEDLVAWGRLTMERMVSAASSEARAYDQPWDEWVVLLRGSARLEVAGAQLALGEGDWVWLPAGTPHTLHETSAGALWLAAHAR